MITCRDAQNLFDRYLDGELSASLRAELNTHRINCPDCQLDLALIETSGDVVRLDAREPALRADFTDRVMVAYRKTQQPKRFPMRRVAMWTGLPSAMAASLLLAGVWLWPTDQSTTPAPGGTVVAGGAGDGAIVRVPQPVEKLLIESKGTQLSADALRALNATPEMRASGFVDSLLTPIVDRAQESMTHARRGADELKLLWQAGLSPARRGAGNSPVSTPEPAAFDDHLSPSPSEVLGIELKPVKAGNAEPNEPI